MFFSRVYMFFLDVYGLRLKLRRSARGLPQPLFSKNGAPKVLFLFVWQVWRVRLRGLARATERNRGIDPKRLLKTMHKALFSAFKRLFLAGGHRVGGARTASEIGGNKGEQPGCGAVGA